MEIEEKRIGIFLCHCGGNISNIIDFAKLKTSINNSCNVTLIKDFEFLCSNTGQEMIKNQCKEKFLDHIVICACSPKLHGKTFRRLAESMGINRYLVEFANLREQCAWLYDNNGDNKSSEASLKAINLVSTAIAKVSNAQSLIPMSIQVNQSVLVIGGGISGITASLTLANQGVHVYLVEKSASIGGTMTKLSRIFSIDKLAEECASCIISPLMYEVWMNRNITLLTLSEVEEINGNAGDFSVKIKQKPRYVDISKCTACGNCEEVCPINIPDEFMEGFSVRKAIYIPFPSAIPRTYIIDKEHCIDCDTCINVCKSGAIKKNDDSMEINTEIKVGIIIVATGHRMYNHAMMPHMGYRFSNVLTQIQLARLLGINSPTKGYLLRPSDNKAPKRIIMIQCVGSRNEKYGHTYCSKICCMVALKHALLIKNQIPDAFITICYMDMRTGGMYEHYLLHAQEKGIHILRGRPCEVFEDPITKNLKVRVYDTISSENLEIDTDLVVLSTAIEPSEGTMDISQRLNLQMSQHGFIKEEHSKLRLVQTSRAGVFVCGTAQGPKDISECIIQANAAAAKTTEFLRKNFLEIDPNFAIINHNCNNCGTCIKSCPYGAITIDKMEDNKMEDNKMEDNNNKIDDKEKIIINPLICTGCGSCVPECPNHAIELPFYSDYQIFAQIKAILEQDTRNIIAFVDEEIGYVAADLAGANRLKYPGNIKIIGIPSSLLLKFDHILYILTHGACGVFLGEGSSGNLKKELLIKTRVQIYHSELQNHKIDPRRLRYTKVYVSAYRQFVNSLNEFYTEMMTLDTLDYIR